MIDTTRYFRQQVLRKRPYLRVEWCERVLLNPLRREDQPDSRVRYWGFIPERGFYLRAELVRNSDLEILRGRREFAQLLA